MQAVLIGSPVRPCNVHIADISAQAVASAERRFGFTPASLSETGPLPFEDAAFDIVFCSSVIEHVTIPKSEVWSLQDHAEFSERSLKHQRTFAGEISRVGRGYFVQVPYRWFPIETHTWLPFVGYLPRAAQVATIRYSNRFWIKKTQPDFYLPSRTEMLALFPDAELRYERSMGLVKSLIVVRPCR